MPNGDRQLQRERRWLTHERYLYLLAKIALVAVVAALAWQVASVVSSIIMPAVVALALAYIFDPLIDLFERRRINRSVAIGALALVALVALAGFALFVAPAFEEQLRRTIEQLPGWLAGAYQSGTRLMRERFGYSAAEIDAIVRKALEGLKDGALGVLGGVGAGLSAVLNILLVPLFLFYFLRDFDRLKTRPLALVPPRYHDYVLTRARTIDALVGHWLRGQLQVALVLALLYSVGLTLVGVRLGAAIGVVAGLLNVIPYFGAALGVALSALMILIEHQSLTTLAGVGFLFAAAALLDGYYLTPRLVGEKVGLEPLHVILAVLIGGALFRFVGLLLAVPVAAALAVLAKDALAWYRATAFYTGNGEASPADIGSSAAS